MDNKERIKEVEKTIQDKSAQVQQLDQIKNTLVTEIVQSQGKLELLKELEADTPTKKVEETNKKV